MAIPSHFLAQLTDSMGLVQRMVPNQAKVTPLAPATDGKSLYLVWLRVPSLCLLQAAGGRWDGAGALFQPRHNAGFMGLAVAQRVSGSWGFSLLVALMGLSSPRG